MKKKIRTICSDKTDIFLYIKTDKGVYELHGYKDMGEWSGVVQLPNGDGVGVEPSSRKDEFLQNVYDWIEKYEKGEVKF